jgi:hypothetical protein
MMAKWTILSEWPPLYPVCATATPAMAPAIALFFGSKRGNELGVCLVEWSTPPLGRTLYQSEPQRPILSRKGKEKHFEIHCPRAEEHLSVICWSRIYHRVKRVLAIIPCASVSKEQHYVSSSSSRRKRFRFSGRAYLF